MSPVLLMVIGLAILALGYLVYSKYLAKRVYRLNDDFSTPSHELTDGVDYVPTNKFILWGHHFTSVAGAAPIVGPAVALIWGWVPAFLWVTLGTVFFAGMHDFGALWASVRNKGQSIGALSGRYIGKRGAGLFLIVIFILLLMVIAAFAVVITGLLISTPTAVIPTWGAIGVALLVGVAVYRLRMPLVAVTIVGVVALYGLIVLGDAVPVVLPETFLGMTPTVFWILTLFIYGAFASLLPVWVLLQPRDYINGVQLFIGLILLYGAVVIGMFVADGAHDIVTPAINMNVPEGTPASCRCSSSQSPVALSQVSTAWSPQEPAPNSWTRRRTPVSSVISAQSVRASWLWEQSSRSPPDFAPWLSGKSFTASSVKPVCSRSSRAAACSWNPVWACLRH